MQQIVLVQKSIFEKTSHPLDCLRLVVFSMLFVFWVSSTATGQQSPAEQSNLAGQQTASQPLATEAQIREWIDDLAAPKFSTRESAMIELAAASEQALPILQSSLAACQNAEQRSRLQSLVEFVRSEIVQKRMDEFVFDPNPDNDHGFAAWPRFSKIAGITRTAKLLLIEMYEEHPILLNELGASFQDAESELVPGSAKAKQLESAAIALANDAIKKSQGPSAGDGLALLFLSSTLPKPVPSEVQRTTQFCIRIIPLAPRFNSDRWKDPMIRLANRWMKRIDITDSYIAERAMQFGVSIKIENTAVIARECLQSKQTALTTKVAALQALSQTGDTNDIQLIESYFSDDSVVADNILPNESTELRDVALAAALVLRQGSLDDYFPQPVNLSFFGFAIMDVRFPTLDPTIRTKAFKGYELEYSADTPFESSIEEN